MYIIREYIKFSNSLLFSISVSSLPVFTVFVHISTPIVSLFLWFLMRLLIMSGWEMAFLITCALHKRNEPPALFGSMSFVKYCVMCSEFHFISFTEIWERPSCCSLHINANENIQEMSVYTLRSSRILNKEN